ncbi:MAG: 16S rRNA (guanine(527)-N(7))-methyltransferase RsmG [Actinobacteria bacterium]|nr:16S rRNA (guanine(527)-N(7))-methyltransferase RsmG [Actinomycetota bacterium]
MEEKDISTRLLEAVEKTAARMGLNVEDCKANMLLAYVEELTRWNKAYNLVGRKLGAQGIVDLCVDAITPLCFKELIAPQKEVVDIGSGAGMPGIPLYILAGPFPLTLVESQRKKITFLQHVRRKLGLEGIRIYPGRAETMCREEDHLNAYETAFARAVADPPRILKLASPILCDGGRLVIFVGEKDAEGLRRSSTLLEARGFKLQTTRSTKRFTSRDNHLALLIKMAK